MDATSDRGKQPVSAALAGPVRAPVPSDPGHRPDRRVGRQPGLRRRLAPGLLPSVPHRRFDLVDRHRRGRRGRRGTGGVPRPAGDPHRHAGLPGRPHPHEPQLPGHRGVRGRLRVAPARRIRRRAGRRRSPAAVRCQLRRPRPVRLAGWSARVPIRRARGREATQAEGFTVRAHSHPRYPAAYGTGEPASPASPPPRHHRTRSPGGRSWLSRHLSPGSSPHSADSSCSPDGSPAAGYASNRTDRRASPPAWSSALRPGRGRAGAVDRLPAAGQRPAGLDRVRRAASGRRARVRHVRPLGRRRADAPPSVSPPAEPPPHWRRPPSKPCPSRSSPHTASSPWPRSSWSCSPPSRPDPDDPGPNPHRRPRRPAAGIPARSAFPGRRPSRAGAEPRGPTARASSSGPTTGTRSSCSTGVRWERLTPRHDSRVDFP